MNLVRFDPQRSLSDVEAQMRMEIPRASGARMYQGIIDRRQRAGW